MTTAVGPDAGAVEWSVKVSPGAEGVSADRNVEYGLPMAGVRDRLLSLDVGHGLPLLRQEIAASGRRRRRRINRVMVGADGDRAKVYCELDGASTPEGADEAMFCLDLWADGRAQVRRYRYLTGTCLDAALAQCTPQLAEGLVALDADIRAGDEAPFRYVLQRAEEATLFTGCDIGMAPDYERSLRSDPTLMRRVVCQPLLSRCGLSEHADAAIDALRARGVIDLNFLGLRDVGAEQPVVNLYGVASPWCWPAGPDEMPAVRALDGQRHVLKSPLIRFSLAGLELRLRATAGSGWTLEHGSQPTTDGALRAAQSLAEQATQPGWDVAAVLDRLRADPSVTGTVTLGVVSG